MALPLPYVITEDERVQGNFDELKKQFPLSRRHMKVTPAVNVGSGGDAPAFENSWTNFDLSLDTRARFWKDPMGLVHIEGTLAAGTVPAAAFTLPAGYRPAFSHRFSAVSNTGASRVDIAPTGQVVPTTGGNTFFALGHIVFKQEQ